MNPDESLELDLDLNDEPVVNKTEERIKNLSSKAKTFATERDEAKAAAEAAQARAEAAEKERDFFANFSKESVKYPAASEHMDAIKEKVMAGYSVEDATVSVLNAEGKLTPQAQEVPADTGTALGGSATTPPLSGESKPVGEMTQEERRAALIEADRRGELRPIIQGMR